MHKQCTLPGLVKLVIVIIIDDYSACRYLPCHLGEAIWLRPRAQDYLHVCCGVLCDVSWWNEWPCQVKCHDLLLVGFHVPYSDNGCFEVGTTYSAVWMHMWSVMLVTMCLNPHFLRYDVHLYAHFHSDMFLLNTSMCMCNTEYGIVLFPGRCKCTPLWQLVVYFVYITARIHQMVMQQWHATTTTRHSYTSPDVWLGLGLLRDIQFGLPAHVTS